MTINEFKAWFDGFTESIDGVPNEKQWERIKAQLQKVAIGSPYDQLRKFQGIPNQVPPYLAQQNGGGTPPAVFLGSRAQQ